jgi:hypothetical protein
MGGGNVDKFVQRALPAATRVAQKLDVPVEAVIGQWGLEVGWGKSVIPGTNNLGNIMDFSGKGVEAVDNKLKRKDKYRQYESVDAFADDFTRLLSNPRYKSVPGTKDPLAYFQKLSDSGYAEAKDYASTGVKATNMVAKSLQRTGAATTASRETPAPAMRKELPPSLPPMAATEESSAAPSRIAGLGPGYQAALALSFLADTDDKEDRDVEKEPGIAEQWLAQTESRPSALAEVADISIKSPFAAPKPQMLAHGGEVAHLAGGGLPFVPTVGIRPSARKQLDDIKAQYDAYGLQADAYNKAVEAYNAGPRTEDFTGTAPVAPGVTPEQHKVMAEKAKQDAVNRNFALQVAANPERYGFSMGRMFAEGGEVAPIGGLNIFQKQRRIEEAKRQKNRNDALRVMSEPDQYGFSLSKMFAEGGEVKEMQDAARKGEAYQALEKYLQSRDEMPSIKTSDRMPDDMYGMFTSDNLGIGSGTVKISNKTPKAALASVLTHEVTHAADRQMTQQAIEQGMFGKSNQYTEAYKKLVGPESRNRTELARTLKPEWADDNRYYRASPKEIAAHGVGAFAGPNLQTRAPRHVDATAATELMVLMDLAQRNVDKGPKGLEKIPAFLRKTAPYGYAEGGEVQLTPQQIERIAAQEAAEREAASRPATVNPNIQRQGEAARKLAAMRDVNTLPDPKTYAAVSGFLGTPPDEQGFSVMHPDREGIKQAGEAGFYAGTAAQIAPLGAALRGIGGKGTTTAAKMMEGMKDVPVGMSIKPVQSIFTPLPSADAPFVGRLDEFVSNLPGTVQKDQFLGMLKGKMRDYDIARAEETLADLPGNAKLSPVDLLNRVKTQYDPAQFKTTVIPPGSPGDFYHSMDNPYIGSAKDGQPLGVIHLSQGLPAEAVEQQVRLKEAGLALSRIATHGGFSPANPVIADDLFGFLQNPGVPLSEATAAKMTEVAQGFRKAAEFDKGWDEARSSILYPILDKRWSGLKDNYAKELSAARNTGFYDSGIQDLASGMATRDISQQGNQWLSANGFAPVNLPDYTTLKDAAVHVGTNPELMQAVRVAFDDARAVNKDFLKGVQEEAKQARFMFGDDTRAIAQYQGQHPSLKNPPSPISFSRFSEHTTEIPGIGKADGIYVNELQSDLLDDLRKFGPKSGSMQKDEKLMGSLEKGMDDLVARIRQAEAAGDTAAVEQLRNQNKALKSQLLRVNSRLSRAEKGEGTYQLVESFPGMETSPQVTQQLMIKNAVSGAMQMGKQFVAFPGKESAQAQLYEKLGPNLKSVVKDLGPGFEFRDVTLRDPDGRQLMHKAIVWGPEAATRIQKKGVPFKDGGAVERQTADHRKYL